MTIPHRDTAAKPARGPRGSRIAWRHAPSSRLLQSGLTLLELVMVVAILAILLTVAVPSMDTFIARSRLKAAADALAQDLQWVRSEAVRQGRPVALAVEENPWCYGVTAKAQLTCDCAAADGSDAACDLKRISGSELSEIRLRATLARTVFEPRRATATNGSFLLTSERGGSIKVIVSRLGRVRLCSPQLTVPGYQDCDG